MRLYEIQDRNAQLVTTLLKVWEDSVRATHLFLSNEEINQIKQYVPQVLTGVGKCISAFVHEADIKQGKMLCVSGDSFQNDNMCLSVMKNTVFDAKRLFLCATKFETVKKESKVF